MVIIILLYFWGTNAWGQGFMKSYYIEHAYGMNGTDIIINNGYILFTVQLHSIYNLSCMGAIEVDTNGIVENERMYINPIGNFLKSKGVKKINNSNIVATGAINKPEYQLQFFFLRVNENLDSLHLLEYGNLQELENTVQIAPLADTIFCSISYGDFNNSYSNCYLLKLDTCLTPLSEVPLNSISNHPLNYTTAIAMSKDSLYTYISTKSTSNLTYFYRSINKVDKNGNIIWQYPITGTLDYPNATMKVVVLENGNLVFRWFDDGIGNTYKHSYITCLNPDGGFVWRYDFNDVAYEKSPADITLAANGDIIGCGTTANPNYNYPCGWLFRLSPEGDLIWEREYISGLNFINFVGANGIAEDISGNIVSSGVIVGTIPTGGYTSNALLLKVLPNGCFTPGCNGGAEDTLIIASTVVGVESVPKPQPQVLGVSPLVVFPNPTNGVVQILLPAQRQNAQILFTNLSGHTLKTVPVPATQYNQSQMSIDITDLPDGMYIISYEVAGKIIATTKLVVAK